MSACHPSPIATGRETVSVFHHFATHMMVAFFGVTTDYMYSSFRQATAVNTHDP